VWCGMVYQNPWGVGVDGTCHAPILEYKGIRELELKKKK